MVKYFLSSMFLLLFANTSWALNFTCVDENSITHDLQTSEGFVHFDGKFMFADDVSQTVSYDRNQMSLFNDDDFDLVIPRNLQEEVQVFMGQLIDSQSESTHQLTCQMAE